MRYKIVCHFPVRGFMGWSQYASGTSRARSDEQIAEEIACGIVVVENKVQTTDYAKPRTPKYGWRT
jgi:hypothetical protein